MKIIFFIGLIAIFLLISGCTVSDYDYSASPTIEATVIALQLDPQLDKAILKIDKITLGKVFDPSQNYLKVGDEFEVEFSYSARPAKIIADRKMICNGQRVERGLNKEGNLDEGCSFELSYTEFKEGYIEYHHWHKILDWVSTQSNNERKLNLNIQDNVLTLPGLKNNSKIKFNTIIYPISRPDLPKKIAVPIGVYEILE